MKKLLVLLFAFMLLFIPFSTSAYEVDLNLESKFGDLFVTNEPPTGNIEESSLPLNTIMLKANFNQYIFRDWADFYSITLGTNFLNTSTNNAEILYYDENINNKVGKLKGNTDLKSFYFDLLLANYLLDYSTPKENYLILIGYEYDNFSYDIGKGSYYNYDTDNKTSISNNIASHNVQTHIPYLGFIYNRKFTNQIKNRFVFKFSPYTYTINSSKNFYNKCVSDSISDGNYFSLKNNIRYKINKDMYVTGGLQYKSINTTGSGTRYYYAGANEGTSYDIKPKVKVTEYSLNIGIQYLF